MAAGVLCFRDMAARTRKIRHDDETRAKFFTYRVLDAAGAVVYVGKGSGRRHLTSARRLNGCAEIIERFSSEKRAYAAEVRLIADLKPAANRHPGGNGSRANRTAARRPTKDEIEMRRVGTRVFAARALLRFDYPFDPALRERIRQVAYAP